MPSPRFRVTIQHSPASDTRRAPRDDHRAGSHSYLIEADSIAEAVAQIPTDKVGELTPTTRIVAVEELRDWAAAEYTDAQIADILHAMGYEPDGYVPELLCRSTFGNHLHVDHDAVVDVATDIVNHISGVYHVHVKLTPDHDEDTVILQALDTATETYRGNTIGTERLSDDPYAEGYAGLIALARGIINRLAALM